MDRTGPLHAHLDESRLRVGDGPENLYFMVAVVVAGVDRLAIQDRLRSVRPPGFKRLHFRDDQRAVQRRHVTLLRELHEQGVIHAVEAHARIPRARREQAGRNRCLSALAGHLAAEGVGEIVIESRQEHQDQRDRRILHAGRDNGVVPPDLDTCSGGSGVRRASPCSGQPMPSQGSSRTNTSVGPRGSVR